MPRNIPAHRVLFRDIAIGAHFRMPHEQVVYVKRAANLADLLGFWRIHPHAPRAGFFHPSPRLEVHPVGAQEASNPAAEPAREIAGLEEIRLSPKGFLTLVFTGERERAHFMAALASSLDASDREITVGVSREGDRCLAVIHATMLRSPLTLSLAD